MDIKLFRVDGPSDSASEHDSQVVMLEVSGGGDFYDPIVSKARELILKSGSQAMLESFDLALTNKAKYSVK